MTDMPNTADNGDPPRGRPQDSASPPGPDLVAECSDAIECLIADVIDPEAARSRGDDPNRLDRLLAGQAVALDLIFTRLAMESAARDTRLPAVLGLALRAQSQSRATLNTLASLAGPRGTPKRSQRNFDEQSVANGKKPSS